MSVEATVDDTARLRADHAEMVMALRNICAMRKVTQEGKPDIIEPYLAAEDMQNEAILALHRVGLSFK